MYSYEQVGKKITTNPMIEMEIGELNKDIIG
jgi:hypothetical protein